MLQAGHEGRKADSRTDQPKGRTRQRLLNAAGALAEEGKTLTVARAAERADLAEATAYPARSSAERQAVLLKLVSWTALAEHRRVLGARPKDRRRTLDITLLCVNYSNRMPFVLPPLERYSFLIPPCH
jgi:hypothetical protein